MRHLAIQKLQNTN